MYITADAYTRDELVEMEIRRLVALAIPHLSNWAPHGCPFLGARWTTVSRCNARQRNLAQFLIVLTSS